MTTFPAMRRMATVVDDKMNTLIAGYVEYRSMLVVRSTAAGWVVRRIPPLFTSIEDRQVPTDLTLQMESAHTWSVDQSILS